MLNILGRDVVKLPQDDGDIENKKKIQKIQLLFDKYTSITQDPLNKDYSTLLKHNY